MRMEKRKILISSLLVLLVAAISIMGVSAQEVEATSSASTSGFLADRHNELGCASCHESGEGSDVETSACLKCHQSWESLAEKTLSMQVNPHASPHFGMDSCTMCHHGHVESENACLSCHTVQH